MRPGRNLSRSDSQLHDLLAIVQGQTGIICSLPDWLDAQAAIWFPQDSLPHRLARLDLRISRQRGNWSANACTHCEALRFDARGPMTSSILRDSFHGIASSSSPFAKHCKGCVVYPVKVVPLRTFMHLGWLSDRLFCILGERYTESPRVGIESLHCVRSSFG